MLRFVSGILVDENGNSRAGAIQHTEAEVEALLAEDAERNRLGRVAAAAEDRMTADQRAGKGYQFSDFEDWARGRNLSTTQRMEAKRLISDFGLTVGEVAGRLKLAPLPVPKVAAAADGHDLVRAKVGPLAESLGKLADRFAAQGVGLHSTNGHIVHMRRLVDDLLHQSNNGAVPHEVLGGPSRWG